MTSETEEIPREDIIDDSEPGEKHLGVLLGDYHFCVPILRIQEILQDWKVTRVPRAAPYFDGLTNLRGQIVGVLCLRERLKVPRQKRTDDTRLVLSHLRCGEDMVLTGLVVDEVLDFISVVESDVEPPSQFAKDIDPSLICGGMLVEQTVYYLLNLDVLA